MGNVATLWEIQLHCGKYSYTVGNVATLWELWLHSESCGCSVGVVALMFKVKGDLTGGGLQC